jgi:two-component system phosphate regulon response regulator PhoB
MAQRVLIVEDEPDIRDLLVFHLEREGFQVVTCKSGAEALRLARSGPPDLILLDLMLPGVSGWEVARRLRQSPETRAVPIIAVSALARPQEREAALHAGCDAYVSKPFTPDDLGRVISATLVGETVGSR